MPKRTDLVSYVNVKTKEIEKLEKELGLLKFMIYHVSTEQRRIEKEREVVQKEVKGIREKTLIAHGIYKEEEAEDVDEKRFMFKLSCDDPEFNIEHFNSEPLVFINDQECQESDQVEPPEPSSDNKPQPPSVFDQALDQFSMVETPSTSSSAPLSSNDNFFSDANFRQSATYSGELLFNNKPKLNLTVPFFQNSDEEEEDEDD